MSDDGKDLMPVVRRPTVVVAAIATSLGLVLFDSLSVATALPAIQDSLEVPALGIEWTVNGFSITLAGLLLVGGRIGALFGQRRALSLSLAGLAGATLVAGLAPTFAVLLAGRLGQGAAAAVALPSAMGLIGQLFPEDPWRRRGFAAMALSGGISGILGAIVGSAITSTVGWRWIFLGTVPFAVMALLAIVRFVPAREVNPAGPRDRRHALDGRGAVLATTALMLMMFGLDFLADRDVGRSTTWLPLLAGAVLMLAFLRHERRAPHPLIPLALLGSTRLMANSFAISGASIVHVAVVVVGSLYFQEVHGLTAFQAGIRIAPELVAVSIGSIIAPWALSRFGSKRVCLACLTLGAGALLWLAWGTTVDSYLYGQLAPLVVLGLGNGLNYVAATRESVGEAAEEASAVSAIETVDEAIRSVTLSVIVDGPPADRARRRRLVGRIRDARRAGLDLLEDSVYSGAASVFEASSHVAGALTVVLTFGLLSNGLGYGGAYAGAAVLVLGCGFAVLRWMPTQRNSIGVHEARRTVEDHVHSVDEFLTD